MDPAPRILIIDDEPPLLRMLSVYLTRKGYQVKTAGSVAQAQQELADGPGVFDAVVLDATIPGTTLDVMAEEILWADFKIRLLVASGYPVDMSALEEAAPGRVAFLHKPFAPDMLAAALRRLLIGSQEESV